MAYIVMAVRYLSLLSYDLYSYGLYSYGREVPLPFHVHDVVQRPRQAERLGRLWPIQLWPIQLWPIQLWSI